MPNRLTANEMKEIEALMEQQIKWDKLFSIADRPSQRNYHDRVAYVLGAPLALVAAEILSQAKKKDVQIFLDAVEKLKTDPGGAEGVIDTIRRQTTRLQKIHAQTSAA